AAAYADRSFMGSGASEGIGGAESGSDWFQVGRLFEDGFTQPLAERELNGIDAIKTGSAERLLPYLGRRDQTIKGNVAERVRPDRAADLVGVEPVGDQLGSGGEVDAVEARPLHRRGRN